MVIKCLNCGYEMEITQALAGTVMHIFSGLLPQTKGPGLDAIKQAFETFIPQMVAGVANQEFGNSTGVKCPSCQKAGIWEG